MADIVGAEEDMEEFVFVHHHHIDPYIGTKPSWRESSIYNTNANGTAGGQFQSSFTAYNTYYQPSAGGMSYYNVVDPDGDQSVSAWGWWAAKSIGNATTWAMGGLWNAGMAVHAWSKGSTPVSSWQAYLGDSEYHSPNHLTSPTTWNGDDDLATSTLYPQEADRADQIAQFYANNSREASATAFPTTPPQQQQQQPPSALSPPSASSPPSSQRPSPTPSPPQFNHYTDYGGYGAYGQMDSRYQ